ncbi:MAG TPA: HD domain-containing protein [Caldisericia bacterium]|nr:HD domain-containing protein [Caldisericia bacterium]HPF48108.1 HD domain-containing protein [Caldisericia bacterium]HPI83955.1 HD domain-containing protein [Caldisericia bacterium]HPQ92561.1 HD domain-containing protein [Caldisericia bacterium]HRV74341.1 HD domain-containing protein [Caldisericia bacterium]
MNIILSKQELIKKAKSVLKTLLKGIPLHYESMMVGGTVRDILLGRTPRDIDIATPDTSELIQTLKSQGFTHVILDLERDIHRMVKGRVHVDITPLKEGNITDLLTRDFTINSIGIVIKTWEVLDPQKGIPDLSKGLVRCRSEERFIKDPLRLIRAFRLGATLEFTIDPVTLRMITKHSHLIGKPSKERIRDELCWTLEAPSSFPHIEEMKRTHLFERILPEFSTLSQIPAHKPHALGLAEHLLWTYKYFEDIMADLDDVLLHHADTAREILCKRVAGGRTLLATVKLAALLHDVGKPETLTTEDRVHFIGHEDAGAEMVTKRMQSLKFSTAEIRIASELIKNHMRPHNLAKLDNISQRAVYRFFRDLDELAIPCMLIALADAYATEMLPWGSLEGYAEFIRTMIDASVKIGKPKPLLDGESIMEILSIKPGPNVGKIQEALLEAQALGEIQTKEDAEKFIKENPLSQ